MINSQAKPKLMLIPGRVLFISIIFYTLLGCASFFINSFFIIWFVSGVILFSLFLIDIFLLFLLTDRLQVKREIPSSLAQNEPVKVKIFINRTAYSLLSPSIRIYDLYPDTMSTHHADTAGIFPYRISGLQRNKLKKPDTLVFEYTIIPNERGPWFFSGTQFLLSSPLFFWKPRVTHNAESKGRTYPNFKQIAQGTNLKGKREKGEIIKIRKRGQGMDFESLRDYQDGDSIRLIDWRASSRRTFWTRRNDMTQNRTPDGRLKSGGLKLIVKNYQEEQDQQILFLIDSGYRLPDEQFDCALGAMLMLSYIALKHGDAVAASSFGAHDIWMPPRKGVSAYSHLMNGLYDLHSEPVPSSPFLALENALTRLRRRSLIVLISNFREEDDKSLASIIPRIKKQHLLLMVSFREKEVEEMVYPEKSPDSAGTPQTNEELLQAAAALTYLTNRRRMYTKWEHSGLLVLETSPQYISTALINKYLSIKKSGKL